MVQVAHLYYYCIFDMLHWVAFFAWPSCSSARAHLQRVWEALHWQQGGSRFRLGILFIDQLSTTPILKGEIKVLSMNKTMYGDVRSECTSSEGCNFNFSVHCPNNMQQLHCFNTTEYISFFIVISGIFVLRRKHDVFMNKMQPYKPKEDFLTTVILVSLSNMGHATFQLT